MSKLQVKIDRECKDLEKVEKVQINGKLFDNYESFSWTQDKTYIKEPLSADGTFESETKIRATLLPKYFVYDTEIEKQHETYTDIISDTTFALLYDACLRCLFSAKNIHCVGENDTIYYEWNYKTLETNVPLPYDDRPCYEKGRITVQYAIVRENSKYDVFDHNFEKFANGEFGNPQKFETMVAYWKAQAEAGYPYASGNVKYFEEMVRKENKNGNINADSCGD